VFVLSRGIRLPILDRRRIVPAMGVVWSPFMARMVGCIKVGREALDFPPYPGELGKRIFENVSKEAWMQWLEHQKMLVNENRLNLADKKARDYLEQQMEKYFFGSGADVAAGYTPPSQK
jgi:Fe-S cluster biosynthesis and repair protein YggX